MSNLRGVFGTEFLVRPLCALLIAIASQFAVAQNLVPLSDDVQTPLLPAGIGRADVEIYGSLAFLWKTEDQATNVVHVIGDFELVFGERVLQSREGVIWMTSRRHEAKSYQALEIFLWKDAYVEDSAGTVTTGNALFVTMNTLGEISVLSTEQSFSSSQSVGAYAEGLSARDSARIRAPDSFATDTPLRVLEPSRDDVKGDQIRPEIVYQARETRSHNINGRMVTVAKGNVYLFRGNSDGTDVFELRADSAVIYLAQDEDVASTGNPPGQLDDRPIDVLQGTQGIRADVANPDLLGGGLGGGASGLAGGMGGGSVEAVYLEGDVVLQYGERVVRSDRLFYDFDDNRMLAEEAVIRLIEPKRNLPIYIRAEQLRQVGPGEYNATNIDLSTSEFHTPHISIGARELTFTDMTPRGERGRRVGLARGSYRMEDTSLRLDGREVLRWPYAKGSFKEGETALREFRTGFSDQFGAVIETRWRLFHILEVETPRGFDGTLGLDYMSKRGPAISADVDYERDDYFGLFRSYYVYDQGEDNLGRFRSEDPDQESRGRLTFRHRHYLPDDWQLTLEFSYLSDRNFLEEYFESEFDEGKEQESLLYLKKQKDNWAFTALLQWRVNDFLTQTEHLPDFSFRVVGEPLADIVTWYSENRLGLVRRRGDEEPELFELLRDGVQESSGVTARVDSRQEIDAPIDLGPVRIVPFGSIRGSYWDDSPHEGGLGRAFGTFGARASMYLSRVYPDVESQLFDIQGMRHIIKPDITVWGSQANRGFQDLYLFDENIEDIDEIDGVTFGVRQRFQTKRGAPGRQRTVDVLTLDVEAGFFGDLDREENRNFGLPIEGHRGDEFTNGFASWSRPENSITRNYVNASAVYRMSDTTALISEANYDTDDGELDVFNISLAVERNPRLSYLVGYRRITDIESDLLAMGINYRITDKHSIAVREVFDLGEGETAEFSIGYVRKSPRWYVGITFDLDNIEEDIGVSLSLWPEGFPNATIGSRRYTGLATSTGIYPNK